DLLHDSSTPITRVLFGGIAAGGDSFLCAKPPPSAQRRALHGHALLAGELRFGRAAFSCNSSWKACGKARGELSEVPSDGRAVFPSHVHVWHRTGRKRKRDP
ncbi:unnamed protein product, partial [Prorocentrum cordatum]